MKNLVFNLRTAKAQAEGCAKVSRMAKVLTTLTLLLSLCIGQMWGDTNRVVYCAISDATKGSYTLKVNANIGDNNTWRQYTMSLVSGKTFNGKKVYTATVSEKYGGVDALQFQLYDGSTWKAQKQPISSWSTYGNWAGKICDYENGDNGTIDTYTTDKYYLEGNTSWISSGWNANATSLMTDNGDYTWSKTVTSLASNSTWHVMKVYGTYGASGTIWRGVSDYSEATHPNITATQGDDNFEFKPALSTSSVTVTYDALAGTFSVTCAAPTITFDREGGSGGPASQNTYYNEATSSITAPTKSYHDFGGYWTGDDGTGTQVIGTNGAWIKNVSNFTDNSSTAKWIVTANYILHAKWTPKNYSITYKDQGNVTYSGSNGGSLPTSYTYGTGIASLTDGVKSGYRFDGWFTTSACTGDPVTTISTSANGNKIFYAKWTENPGGTVSLTAGTGGEVSADNSSWGTSKSHTGIKSTTPLNIYARANSGYTFNTWTKTSGSGTITTNAASGVFTPVANADAALTASFTEIKYTVNVALADASQADGTTDPNGNVQVGAITPVTITAPTPKTGYRSTGRWTTTGGVTVANETANPTTITATSAGTVRWTFDEDLSSPWIVAGGNKIVTTGTTWRTTADANNTMLKKTGHSTESVVYFTVPVTTVCSGDNNENFQFKIYNTSTSTWYGLFASGSYYLLKAEDGTEKSLVKDNQNIELRAYVTGNYEFKLDYSTSTPKLTVNWPEINQVRISSASPADATNVGDFDLSAPVSNVRSKTLSLNANTTYTFKIVYDSEWYGYNSGTFTRSTSTSSNSRTLSTSGGDMTLTTDYAGDYTFKFNESTKELSIDFPEAYKIHFERGAINGGKVSGYPIATQVETSSSVTSDVTWVKAGNTVTLTASQVKDNGHYIWFGWYTVQDPDRANPTTNRLGTSYAYTTPAITSASNKNFYAIYFETEYWVDKYIVGQGSVSPSEGQNAYVETPVSFTAAPGTGYKFDNWTQRSGALTIASPTNTTTNVNATAASVLQANFSPRWSVIGTGAFGGWTAYDAHKFDNYAVVSTKAVGYNTITLAANTTYNIKIRDRQANTTYGGSASQTIDYAHSGTGNEYTVATTSSPQNVIIQSAAGGTYTLNWNLTDKKIAVVYPTSWYITSGQKTTGQADNVGGSFTAVDNSSNNVYGGKFVANNATVTCTASPNTGYTFGGWYSDASCETAYVNGTGGATISGEGGVVLTLSSITANKTIYAKFTPKTYTVTLTQTGAASTGTAEVTATYNATAPSIASLPTAPQGYGFMGYYTATGGGGSQIVAANGTWQNVDGYTSGGKWVRDADTELFAYFKKAKITALTCDATIVTPNAIMGVTPTISPTPAGTTSICWRVLHGNGNPLAEQPTFSANPTTGSTKVTFPASSASGTYLIEAVLRTGSVCGAGTVLDSVTASFQVAGKHIVTIQYKSGDFTLKASTNVDGKPLDWSDDIAAPDITGYTFASWEAGDGVTIKDAAGEDKTTSTYSTIKIKANYDSKLTALYTKKNMIYFYNTLGWDTVFVYFYENGNYWSDTYGTGANQYQNWGGQNPYWFGEHGGMKRVAPGSDIWYFDYTEAGYETRANVVFADKDQSKQVDCAGDNACIFFSDNAKVARRSDHNSSLPMFVPLSNQTGVNKNENRAKYYSDGYWMNYPENTGYTLKLYSSQDATTPTRTIRFPFSADTKMPLKLDVELNEAATNYYYTIYREDGQVLSASYGMNKNYHTNVQLNSPSTKISIKTTAPGIYKYSLVYMNNSGTKDYYISVDYPIVEKDYRISYSDNATWSQGSAHTSGWYHPSDVIRKNTDAEVTQYDTVSFYISKGAGITASMKFQYAKTIVEEGTITWQDVTGGGINAADTISKAGVYNFIIKQEGTAKPVVEKVEPYTGKFYIRTDCAGSTKWDYYRASDHEMPYTEFSMSDANSFGEKYSHYYTHWCPGGTNIKFVVANEYSSCISDTLESDLHNWGNLNDGGWLKHQDGKSETEDIYSANVRFMYNQETNKISRAYVASSTNPARKFLVLRGNQVIKGEDGSTAINDQSVTNGAILSDKENWIYERILYINPGTRFKLFACYAEATPSESGAQYFRGAYDSNRFTSDANSVILISGTTDSYQKARVLYDFKTNRLVCAWLPSDEPIDETLDIDADVMVIRDHQEAAECITFSGDGELKKVKTVYGAMKFNRWTLNNRYRGKGGVEDNNKDHCDSPADIAEYHGILPAGEQKSVYERSLYFISFPFDVKVSEIFGFGTYGKHWILEYYDGLNRAKNGYWIDSPANWKYVTPSMAKTYELKAYEGYILCLSLGRMAYDNTEFWANNISNVELYFPSKTPMANIQTTDVNISGLNEIAGDPYRCTINREGKDGDRRVKDSYWRCLGVPSYNIYAGQLKDGEGGADIKWQTDYKKFPFLYAWNMTDNTLTPQATNAFSFKPMHAYLTQIGTAIYWKNVSATPASVMARQTEEPTEYNWCLTLNAGEQMIDQTYVRMSTDEVITNEFDFGQDLSKELNTGRSDIYSFIGNERAAANSMQMNTETTTIVPLGLNIEATGEYTFSIPDGTNGIGITLIDEETGIRTSLSALDYTVELAAGDYTERFWLEISPVKGAETGIDPGVDARENGVRKVMIDGLLYIVRDGKMFDATGKRVE